MGSSKKHKKESKKRKHRSRSRSPLSDPPDSPREKERRHHKKHKERRREKSSDVEEVPVDSHLEKVEKRHSPEYLHEEPVSKSRGSNSNAGEGDVLSIEETNKLRAKLGLKPLQVEKESHTADGKIVDDLGEFYHKPAENINAIKHREKLKERIAEKKAKRLAETRLLNVRGLADSGSEDEDANAWVSKNREIIKQKEEAAKRAAILDEMDKEFGLGALAEEEEIQTRNEAYSVRDLKGLKVAHGTEQLPEGRSVVLTLEDKDVLDEGEDTLINVNIKDQERYDKSNLNKKQKTGYNPYEGTDDPELYGATVEKQVLSKYDEEIHGEKKKQGFTIGDEDRLEMENFKKMMIKEKLSSKRLESLVLPAPQLASMYYSEEELKAKFKKPKKKGKLRKKLKLENMTGEEASNRGALITDDTEIKTESLRNIKRDEDDEEEDDNELEKALAKARNLTLAKRNNALPKLEELVQIVKKEEVEEGIETVAGGIVLDSTAEFCRTLGDIPTYGQAGNRDVGADEIMDLEEEEEEMNQAGGAWSSVNPDSEEPLVDVNRDGGGALEAEPRMDAGVGGALRLALSKGYLERGREARPAPPALPNLRAAHYSIDDKAHNDDDKLTRRERGHSGPVIDFKEKDGFKPHVKLDYVDDEGRPLKPKEAFRYLSHKFHGKGPGKNKQEKRIKQSAQEGLMKKMNSTDTPLGTLALLQARQKEARTAYLVLSGTKKSTSL